MLDLFKYKYSSIGFDSLKKQNNNVCQLNMCFGKPQRKSFASLCDCEERRVVAGMTKPLFRRKREELTVSIRTPSGSVPATLFGAWRDTCTYPEKVVPALFARSNVRLSQPGVRLTATTYYGEKIWFGNVP